MIQYVFSFSSIPKDFAAILFAKSNKEKWHLKRSRTALHFDGGGKKKGIVGIVDGMLGLSMECWGLKGLWLVIMVGKGDIVTLGNVGMVGNNDK